ASDMPSSQLQTPQGSVFFIADAHLGIEDETAEAAKVKALCDLLDYLRGKACNLYLAGDLFDFWFEFRTAAPPEHVAVLNALSALAESGTSITFLGGNHDYWAGDIFKRRSRAVVSRDPVTVTHFGSKIFIAHGDGLPDGDWGYRMLKAVIRSGPAIAAFRILPPTLGSAIARWASSLSTIDTARIERAVGPMRRFLFDKLDEGFDAVIVGHIHTPRLWERNGGTAIIVGDWMANRAVVELDASGFHMLKWVEGGLVPADPDTP
ncbi:UDP-2,3-diacylglucosamine diphosphatase, partial [bacterium]|nr:UDP-2,3-diacylglucosamine diphosphatase [bacterium]